MIPTILLGLLLLAGLGVTKRCDKMSLDQLCQHQRKCQSHVLDLREICNSRIQVQNSYHRQGTLRSSVSILRSTSVTYLDATPPVILSGPRNVTVPPGGELSLSCLVEGAPTPDVIISFREDAYLEKPEASFGSSIMLSVSKAVHKQVDVIAEYDEGWYRCVGANSEGVVFADSYVTVKDLCAEKDCPSNKVCEADYDLEIAECVCPSCGVDDFLGDNWVCGNNCASYFSECSLKEDNCWEDTNYTMFRSTYCPEFTQPVFTVVPEAELEVTYQQSITLHCEAEPSGHEPGPPPTIVWYNEYSELLAEGDSLVLAPEEEMSVVCVAVHCPGTIGAERLLQTLPTLITIKEESSKVNAGASCHVFGDPHLITFDGRSYVMEGACDYVLAMDCMMASWFVYGRFSACGNDMTCLESVTLFYGYSMMLELQRGWLVNNQGVKLPIRLGEELVVNGDVSLLFDGEWLSLYFVGNELRWDGLMGMQLYLAASAGRTCGLCGDNNGWSGDDFRSRWYYTVESDVGRFVDSWRLDRQGLCELETTRAEVTVSEEARSVCNALFDSEYIKRCEAEVAGAEYLEACTQDYTTSGYMRDEFRIECSILQSYAEQCESKGIDMGLWRTATGCTSISDLQTFTIAQGCPQETSPFS